MNDLARALVGYGCVFVAMTAISAVLWPRRRLAAALVWWGSPVAILVFFRDAPGPFPAIAGMGGIFIPLRALDAARHPQPRTRAELFRFMFDFSAVPAKDEQPVPPRGVIVRRGLRGVLLGLVSAGLMVLGWRLELWRSAPYLDDLLVLLEAACVFTGAVDLMVAGLWAAGRPMPDLHDGSFWRARSLRLFWWQWNGAVSRILGRTIFDPVTGRGRRRVALGVLLTFAMSGALHAVPLLVASPDRVASAKLAASAMAFFVVHGLMVIVEGKVARRREWLGRAIVLITFAATAPLYPVPHGLVVGLHGRPPEALTFWRLFG